MPIQEETAGTRPWIVFIGISRVANPTKITDFINWSSGAVVGPRHILTAAHVCKMLDRDCRKWNAALGGKQSWLFCIPGFHGTFDVNTKAYPIGDDAFEVSSHSLFASCTFTDLDQYKKQIDKIFRQSFHDNDVGMYFLDEDLPSTVPHALYEAATDDFLDPAKKNSFYAHGYTYEKRGILMYAGTYSFKTYPAKFAMHDAPLGPGASGGPVWRSASPKPVVIGTVSGYKEYNFGGPKRYTLLGRDGKKIVVEDPETGEYRPLESYDPEPPPPKIVDAGIAARLTADTVLEIKEWLKK